MSVDRVRHGRQIRLAEIGEAGQERLVASSVVLLGAGDAREIEASYLARAGVRVVDDANARANARTKGPLDGTSRDERLHDDVIGSLGLRDFAAAQVADGAVRALLGMRKILGIGRGGGG